MTFDFCFCISVCIWSQYFPSQEGLRTLCVAYRRLSQSEYEEACHRLTEAKLALQDREQKLALAYDIIERELVLLGATAVEDRSVHVESERKGKSSKMGLESILMAPGVSSRHCATRVGKNDFSLISWLVPNSAASFASVLSFWLEY